MYGFTFVPAPSDGFATDEQSVESRFHSAASDAVVAQCIYNALVLVATEFGKPGGGKGKMAIGPDGDRKKAGIQQAVSLQMQTTGLAPSGRHE